MTKATVNLQTIGMKPISLLGSGSDGIVVKAMNNVTKKIYAVKIVSIAGDRIKFFEREAMNTLKLSGLSNIIATKSYQKISNEYGAITMEYIPTGDLMTYFLSKNKLAEKEVQKIFKEMCIAIAHCHDNNIAHLDIKPENFLFEKATNTVKLIDFHRSYDWNDDYNNMIEQLNGYTSVKYRPPELLNKNQKNALDKIDVWSLGVCLFGLLYGSFPFQFSGVIDGELDYNFILFKKALNERDDVSKKAKSLIRMILNPNPDQRPTINEVLEHPFF